MDPLPQGSSTANPLEEYFRERQGRLIHKWLHYFEIYHRHLHPYRNRPVTILEFGVSQGGSLEMWLEYFGGEATIYGVDIDPRCQQFAQDRVTIFIGDQEDRGFLRGLRDEVGPIDVVIEDGGHMMKQQIATFEEIWPAVSEGGVFLIEDTHTSYWKHYGGGHRRKGTFIEYAKQLIDDMHAWHSQSRRLRVGDFTRQIRGMHVYDSIIVFDKAHVPPPRHEMVGERSFPTESTDDAASAMR